MTDVTDALIALLGDEHVIAGEPLQDIGGFDLGAPLAVLRPANREQVAQVLAFAARRGVPVVPVGARTAYWHPLHLATTVALDLSRLDTLAFNGSVARCGAGIGVRRLDVALRERGYHLPLHPDAFGETSLGAMVATACTSGIGMGLASIGQLVAGLGVVLGDGRVLHTGTAAIGVPLLRDAVPDLTGAFIGAEGALGVVTDVDLALTPAPWRVRLTFSVPTTRAGDLAALGREFAGLYDTLRAVRSVEPPATPTDFRVDVWLISPLSEAEAEARARHVAGEIERRFDVRAEVSPEGEAARAGRSPHYDQRWQGSEGGHIPFRDGWSLIGMDVNAPYSELPALLSLGERQLLEAVTLGAKQSRIALYFAPGFVNFGLHVTCPRDPVAPWHEHQSRWLAALSELPVVPYRFGRCWPAASTDRLDPTSRGALTALRRALDPRQVLHPGHPWAFEDA